MRGYRAEVAFDGVRILSGGALVLIEDGLVAAVEPASAPAPDGCEVTHLPGTTLLPGLIDTHVHLCGDSSSRALERIPELTPDELDAVITNSEQRHLQAGVTAVRDLGDHEWAVLDRTNDAGPTVVGTGPPITSPGGHCCSMGGATTGLEALRRAVLERVERRAGVVKIMASGGVMTPGTDLLGCQFTVEELRAVVDEAHRHGLPVTAHAHPLSAVERSLSAGVDGIEHCSCLTPEGPRLPEELAGRLARGGPLVCPTVGRRPHGLVAPPAIRERMEAAHATYEEHLPHVSRLHRAGIVLLAGTDAGIGPAKPHGLVPMAIADLVMECGVPVDEAITGATSLAAQACGLEERTGRLSPGLDADLLLVDGNPFEDVTALQRPRRVVSRGREVALA